MNETAISTEREMMTQSPGERKRRLKRGLQSFAKSARASQVIFPAAPPVPAPLFANVSQPQHPPLSRTPAPPAGSLAFHISAGLDRSLSGRALTTQSHSSFPLWPDPINTPILERRHKYCALILKHGIKGLYRKLLSTVCHQRGQGSASSPALAMGVTLARLGQVKGLCKEQALQSLGGVGEHWGVLLPFMTKMSPLSPGPAQRVPAGDPREGTEQRGKCSPAEKCDTESFKPRTENPQNFLCPRWTAWPLPPTVRPCPQTLSTKAVLLETGLLKES